MLQIPQALLDNKVSKEAFHHSGKKLLKSIAQALPLDAGAYEIRSSNSGTGAFGEVVLHAEHVYLQVRASDSGFEVIHRSCLSQKDFTGGQSRYVKLRDLQSHTGAERFIGKLQQLNRSRTQQNVHCGGLAHA